MGSSRAKKSAGKGEGTTRMAADILSGVGDVGLEGQETADKVESSPDKIEGATG